MAVLLFSAEIYPNQAKVGWRHDDDAEHLKDYPTVKFFFTPHLTGQITNEKVQRVLPTADCLKPSLSVLARTCANLNPFLVLGSRGSGTS